MSKSKEEGKAKPVQINKLPQQAFSRFGKTGGMFGPGSVGNLSRGQFKPPAIRITQNKGGGGK